MASTRNHCVRDARRRSWAKALTWRIIGTVVTIVGFGLATGDWVLASGVGLLLNLIKSVIYYAHERVWERVSWGRNCTITKEDE